MSLKGVEVSATVPRVTEEQLQNVYSALVANFPFKSVDMAFDLTTNNVTVLIGIELSDGLDSDEFARDLAKDAFIRAFEETDNPALETTSRIDAFC